MILLNHQIYRHIKSKYWYQINNNMTGGSNNPYNYSIEINNNDTVWINNSGNTYSVDNNVKLIQNTTKITTLDNINPYALVASTTAANKTFVTTLTSASPNLVVI
jgi:hypothetical protein